MPTQKRFQVWLANRPSLDRLRRMKFWNGDSLFSGKNLAALALSTVVTFVVGIILVNNWSCLISALERWQELTGSLVGAAVGALTAILIFVKTESAKAEKDRGDHVHLLHRSIGAALQNLTEIDSTLHVFVDETLSKIIEKIDTTNDGAAPSIGAGFIPLMHVTDISDELLRRFSGSGYVDIQTIALVNRSKDWRKIIDDLNRQFDTTLLLNNQIALSGVNQTHALANKTFKTNLENFRDYVVAQTFHNNVPVYALQLVRAQVAVGYLMEWGPKKWQEFFKNKIRPSHMPEDIDAFFADKVNAKIDLYQSEFKSKLNKAAVVETTTK